MPFFLHPGWLAAFAALALPVVLHLISRGRARRVQVGSIALLQASEVRSARRLRPTEPWLLAVRCLLLALLALALAGPLVTRPVTAADTWVLVEPARFADRNGLDEDERWAELRRSGAPLRWLAPGLPSSAAPPRGEADAADLWSLVREADRAAPPGVPFAVFAHDRVATLRGRRPALARPVEWRVRPAPPATWVARRRVRSDGDEIVVGESDPEATRFLGQHAAAADGGTVEPPPPLRAVVRHARERQADAGYFRHGLATAAELAGVPLELGSEDAELGSADLVAWLSPLPAPETVLGVAAAGGVVLVDGGERTADCAGTVALADGSRITRRRCAPVPEPSAAFGAPSWVDDAGRPLLRVARHGEGTVYRFDGRLHPAWSDLVHHPAWPEWMLERVEELAPAPSDENPASDRRAAGSQGAPRSTVQAAAEPDAPWAVPSRVVENGLWLLVALLLFVERWLARPRAEVV